jgi:TonB family protein
MSVGASAAPTPPLRPSGAWVLDYDATQCIASRQYGTDKNAVTFAIRPAPNGGNYELLIGRPRYGPMFGEELNGSVDFGNGPIKAWLLHYGGSKKKVSIDQFRISAAEMAQARTATSVNLRTGDGMSANIALTNMPELMKGMDDCNADLKRYWNIENPEKQNVAVEVKGDVRNVFRSTDYPQEAMKNRQEGRVQFLLLINEQGKVAGCNVVEASGIPALDGMGCQVIVERAKFQPALDKQGKPIRSAYVTPPVVWRIGW